MNKRVFCLIIFLFFLSGKACAEEVFLNAEETVTLALRQNPNILLKAEDVKKAKEKIAEANAGLLPTLTFSASWRDIRSLYAKDFSQFDAQAALKQPLYRGGRVINTIAYNKYGLSIAEAVLDREKLEVALNARRAFYTLVLSAELVKINKAILENTLMHFDFLKARYESGQVSEIETLRIESLRESVRRAYLASLNEEEAAAAFLLNLLNLDHKIKIKAQGDFDYEPAEFTYDESFLKAISQRPEIREYEAREQAGRKAVEIAKADSLPSVYASWDYYSSSAQTSAGSLRRAWQDWNVLGVTFSWPVFDGFATRAKVRQAIVDLKQARLLKDKAVADIALEFKKSYLDLKNAMAKIKAAQADLNLYQDIFESTQEKYRAGITSALDLEDISLSYQIALFNQKQAIYDYLIAKAAFEKAAGGV